MKASHPLIENLATLNASQANWNTDRLKILLEKLGNPENKLPPVFHITGTNGKGSTAAFIRSILESHGLKVHSFTSPHLVHYNERIIIAGKEIADEQLKKYIPEIKKINKNDPITFFEMTVAIAFKAFTENKADAVILEVGMGGRLDGTNVIPKSKVSIFTPISKDHTKSLGNTYEKIAKEKSYIMKKNCPALSAKQKPKALKELQKKAIELNCSLAVENKDFSYKIIKNGFKYKGIKNNFTLPNPSLIGKHQIQNATLAIAAIEKSNLAVLKEEKIAFALKNTFWLGRLHKIQKGNLENLTDPTNEIWVDGAHNKNAGKVLKEFIKNNWQNQNLHIIIGMLRTKDTKSFLKYMLDIKNLKSLQILTIENRTAGLNKEMLAKTAAKINTTKNIQTAQNIKEALKNIKDKNAKILITGSLYLIGDILDKNKKT